MSLFKTLFAKIPSLFPSGRHSLLFLNLTQSFGVVNDNIFKFTMAFLLIDALGKAEASSILSATGAIYVLPFLLFSSLAGILADRFSKQKLLVLMKGAEIAIMILALFAFAGKSVFGCYSLLFLLSAHSALFGPSKYGIIPELVDKERVSKANGLVTSFTYLSIIIGTFLASFLTEVSSRNFVFVAAFCLLVSLGGFFSALSIKSTKPQDPGKKINFFFIREIYRTLNYAKGIHHLLAAVLGAAYFLLIGAFTQLNIIPFALHAMNLSEIAGGYLFLSTALGIALGAFLAGRASKSKIELGLSCFAGLGLSLFLILLAPFCSSLPLTIFILFGLGVCGGLFIVPFDTFIQVGSDQEKRGQTIAAMNFLSFLGVLIASFLVLFLNHTCSLSPATSFAVMGGVTLFVSLLLTFAISDLFLSYFSRRILCPLTGFTLPSPERAKEMEGAILIIERGSWKRALQLAAFLPHVHFLIPNGTSLFRPFFRFLSSVRFLSEEKSSEELLEIAHGEIKEGRPVCLLLDSFLTQEEEKKRSLLSFFKRGAPIWKVSFKKGERGKETLFFEKE